jgi:hypothetical protein
VAINQTAQEAEIGKTAIFALDQTTGVFRACEVDVDGILQTTAGSGGGGSGGDVRIKDASAAQFASVDATGRLSVLVANFPATQPVSGTVALDAPSLAALETISVANFPATQPISGSVSVSNFPATQPVSGTVAISGSVAVTGPLTDTQLRASAVPVSLASVPTHAVTQSGAWTADVTDRAARDNGRVRIWDGTDTLDINALGAAQVSVANNPLPPLGAGTANIGDVDVLTLPAIPAGTNRIGSVRPVDSADADLTSAKWAALAGRYLGVHKASDLGRNLLCFGFGATGGGFVSTASAETLLTMCWSKDGAALSSGTTYAVTASKRLRIMGVFLFERSSTGNTTATTAFLRLRINTGGAVTTSSPLQLSYIALHPAAASTPSTTPPFNLSAQDGFELQAGWNFGIGIGSTGWTATTQVPVWDGCLVGFEY